MSISAMKQALEALALVASSDEWQGCQTYEGQIATSAYEALSQAIAEAEKQEPVGEIVHAFSDLVSVSILKMPPVGTKLYTTPPKREWHGLGINQRIRLADRFHIGIDAVEAIEAKLKERNNG